MNIAGKTLAGICVGLLLLYPALGVLALFFTGADDHGALAALFAITTGAALSVGFVLGLPQFSDHTSRELRLFVGAIVVVCALMSAVYWITDEIENAWLGAAIILPVLVIPCVLAWFVDKVNKEGTEHEGE